MRVSDRLDLISKIGRELQSRYTFDELYSYLWAFEIPQLENGPTGSKWSYTKAVLDTQPTDVVLKIAEDLELQGVSPVTPAKHPRNRDAEGKFRLFISHISKDKDKAKRLKDALAKYQIASFVAHEDIHPTLEWQSEIEKALRTMEAFVAIHTPGFSQSIWTQQEIGFAVGRGIKIISLRMGEDPTGFISKHQALPRRNRRAEEIADEMYQLMIEDKRTQDRLKLLNGLNEPEQADEIPF